MIPSLHEKVQKKKSFRQRNFEILCIYCSEVSQVWFSTSQFRMFILTHPLRLLSFFRCEFLKEEA